ncbi:ribosome recycling factor [Candidatus Nasuia deltocephalinicola str. NAS-ALF]|uniref:Ribosome recycling factor n=1 Tax=Candidatus Nasuia deltocephalinicola str. NAS-ALF TaxID=1343077 RepID=S5SQ36_9PROT|nr:ribosome recycling factor [Candidatus Nasuia deltocephalinicola str. NAS-ALF]
MNNIIKEMEDCLKNFKISLEKLTINNNFKNVIENLNINRNLKLKEICIIEKNKEDDVLLIPLKFSDFELIENFLKKNKNLLFVKSKENIKLLNNKIITEEEKLNLIKNIKKEKEKFKIIIRNIRNKNKQIWNKDHNKKDIMQKQINKYNNELDNFCEKKISSIIKINK